MKKLGTCHISIIFFKPSLVHLMLTGCWCWEGVVSAWGRCTQWRASWPASSCGLLSSSTILSWLSSLLLVLVLEPCYLLTSLVLWILNSTSLESSLFSDASDYDSVYSGLWGYSCILSIAAVSWASHPVSLLVQKLILQFLFGKFLGNHSWLELLMSSSQFLLKSLWFKQCQRFAAKNIEIFF